MVRVVGAEMKTEVRILRTHARTRTHTHARTRTRTRQTYPVKCVRNLNGHSIGPYQIHAGDMWFCVLCV